MKEPSIKDFAEYFIMGLHLGICDLSELITWVDKLIAKIDYPPYWMIDLSTSSNKIIEDVIHILNSVPGKADIEISFNLLVAKLALEKPNLILDNQRFIDPKDSRLFTQLYFLVIKYDDVPSYIRGNIFEVYLGMDILEEGYLNWETFHQDYQNLLNVGKNYQHFVR